MPALNKKFVIAVMLSSGNVTATSTTDNGGAAKVKSGLAVASSSITTPAALASLFEATSFLGSAANIEAVSNVVTSGTNRLIVARLAPVPQANSLSFNVTRSSVYTGNVMSVVAFEDEGINADVEVAALASFMGALNTAMS